MNAEQSAALQSETKRVMQRLADVGASRSAGSLMLGHLLGKLQRGVAMDPETALDIIDSARESYEIDG